MTTGPFLSPFLRATLRNLESLQSAWVRMSELGYAPRAIAVDEPEGCTRTRCAGAHQGYPGSEHRWALHCLLCSVDIEVFYSHMRERKGKNPAPPRRHKGCPFSGPSKASKRAARYFEIGRQIPAWDLDALAVAA